MRAVIQRVRKASVTVEGKTTGQIGEGLLVFIGIEQADGSADIDWLARKIPQLRIFEDDDGRMNQSVIERNGEILLISQFTLYGNLSKGARPSFNRAAPPEIAIPLYEQLIDTLKAQLGKEIATGKFGSMMNILALNNGPVTLILDTKNKKL